MTEIDNEKNRVINLETKKTKELKMILWRHTNKMGVFGCFEVTMGWYGRERVDYMTYDTRGVFRCYEIKISKEDFHSKCKHTFVGHYNYYVMPPEVYQAVKDDIPDYVGVYEVKFNALDCVKKARKQVVLNPEELKDYLIRSLCRDAGKLVDNGDDRKLHQLRRELEQVRRSKEYYYKEYWHLKRKLEGLTDE